jgi:hypothetical protein
MSYQFKRLKIIPYYKLKTVMAGDIMNFMKKKKVLFIHIPKCGGTSVKKSLYPKSRSKYGHGHITYKDALKIYGPQVVDSMFSFSFVRNPWQRLFSAFTFLADGGMDLFDTIVHGTRLRPYESFEKFVFEWLSKDNIYNTRPNIIHLMPQHEFICLDGEIAVDFVGRFENFDDDYEKIRKEIGFGTELKHINKTSRGRSYRDVYTPQMVDKVAEVYDQDIELFDYSFE